MVVFTGTGLLEGKYHIETDPSIKPVVHPPCRVPVALRSMLEEELSNFGRAGHHHTGDNANPVDEQYGNYDKAIYREVEDMH